MHMKKCLHLAFLVVILANLLWPSSAGAQGGAGIITGTATDTDHQVLPGAQVRLDPGNIAVTTNQQGEFTIPNVAPGTYTLTVSYLGFSPFTASVAVVAGQVAKVDAVLAVATQNEQVVVTSGRSYGEAEAINEVRASDTLVNILPAAVIVSLPNADPSGRTIIPITPTPPITGPSGDLYLYPHLQEDAEGSFRIRRRLRFVAAGLNLNNKVFGFYNGSNPFFIQREYYKPRYTFGFRWEPFAEK
jgi:hypothetical protein